LRRMSGAALPEKRQRSASPFYKLDARGGGCPPTAKAASSRASRGDRDFHGRCLLTTYTGFVGIAATADFLLGAEDLDALVALRRALPNRTDLRRLPRDSLQLSRDDATLDLTVPRGTRTPVALVSAQRRRYLFVLSFVKTAGRGKACPSPSGSA